MNSSFTKKMLAVVFLVVVSLMFPKTLGSVAYASSEPIIVYDIRHFTSELSVGNTFTDLNWVTYDKMLALQSLQGNVNRGQPKLFLNFIKGFPNFIPKYIVQDMIQQSVNLDMQLFDYMCAPSSPDTCISQYTELNGRPILRFTENNATNVANHKLTVEDLMNQYYKNDVNGIVVWDKRVSATSNAAMTIAGADHLVALLHDPANQNELLNRVKVKSGLQEKVNLYTLDFTNKDVAPDGVSAVGSTKNNVYLWLIEKYVKTKKIDPMNVGFITDASRNKKLHVNGYFATTNFDLLVQKKALVFDLTPWADEKPSDDPEQPLGTDRRTFNALLTALNSASPGVKQFYGFPPVFFKYSDYGDGGKHTGVETEWEYLPLVSSKGFFVADNLGYTGCCQKESHMFTNISFYSRLTMLNSNQYLNDASNVPQTIPPLDNNKTYLLLLMGDYDSSGGLMRAMLSPIIWGSPSRGNLPLTWMINPKKLDDVPILADMLKSQRTPKDFFTAEEGPGYVDVSVFPEDRYNELVAISKASYAKYHMDFTPFQIPETGQKDYARLAKLSPLGVGMNNGEPNTSIINNKTPFCSVKGYLNHFDSEEVMVEKIHDMNYGKFLCIRVVFKTPAEMEHVINALKQQFPEKHYEVVDPYTFYGLIAKKYNVSYQLPVYTQNPTPTPTPSGSLIGDVDGNKKIDRTDYNLLVTNFWEKLSIGEGAPTVLTLTGDLNGDGMVNLYDYNILLGVLK